VAQRLHFGPVRFMPLKRARRVHVRPVIRFVLAGIVGAFVALVLLALVYVGNAEGGFENTTAATGMGWLVPVLAGGVTAALAWALLASSRKSDETSELSPRGECTQCGGSILGDWRLCPHCGALLPPGDSSASEC
jgi:hypothetical protein